MYAESTPSKTRLIHLNVNGRRVELEVPARRTLLNLLRNDLGLTGTKKGCDQGTCGCCTVLMNGTPIYSCMTLAFDADGQDILTIEGLSEGAELHPLQKAFIEHYASQCGYCTPGMILAGKALLDHNPNPTEEDVRQALSGNLCRCNFARIIEAVLAAARMMR